MIAKHLSFTSQPGRKTGEFTTVVGGMPVIHSEDSCLRGADVAAALRPLTFARFTFRLRATSPWRLPIYKGATLRGALGRGLKMLCVGNPVGANNEKQCTCPPDLACKYGYLFESSGSQGHDLPRPYVISSPLDAQQNFEPGESLDFGLVLIGHAIDELPAILHTLTEVGRRTGIGQIGHNPDRGRFTVESVWQHRFREAPTLIYDGDEEGMAKIRNPESLADIPFPQGVSPDASSVALTFLTPTHIRYKLKEDSHQKDLRQPVFEPLVRRLIERMQGLVEAHCNGSVRLDFGGLFRAAREVDMSATDTRWITFERYSFHQVERIPVSGFVGAAHYCGDLRPFIPLLMLGEVLHVGKGAVLGQGQYCIDDLLQRLQPDHLRQLYSSQLDSRAHAPEEGSRK